MDATFETYQQLSEDYERIERAIVFLERNYQAQPELKEIAESVGLSEYHFQRLFSRWVGISPKRFLQYLTKEHAKQMLERSHSVLDTAYQSGLSGPGRLHDLLVVTEAVTPGEYKSRGEGLTIRYGIHPSPFGDCLVARTERGICYLAFMDHHEPDQVVGEMIQRWHKAEVLVDQARTWPLIKQLFSAVENTPIAPLQLHLLGTNFQLKVWEALLQVPPGQVVSYEDLAMRLGAPNAARAVGSALGRNPVPVLIPCHRVIRKVGDFGNYRYGAARKKALLAWEYARSPVEAAV